MGVSSAQRGQVSAGCIVSLVVMLLVVIVAIQVVPVMINIGDMDKEIALLAERANISSYTNERIKGRILQKAEALGLRVAKENIKVRRTSRDIEIVVEYDCEVDLLVFTHRWRKVHDVRRPLF
jgi:hypothetical protein